ncbi:hypothetical protein GGR56DRAFT_668355 [Xylariaceae sp. FL0804]|nr:hypothetical protein GGR56DRAFT_668355 [Xylariaceae sp. FL0804]
MLLTSEPLLAVFDYHVQLRAQDTFESGYFSSAVDKAWQTRCVILVTLEDDDLACNVGSFCIKGVDSGLGKKDKYTFGPDNGEDPGPNNHVYSNDEDDDNKNTDCGGDDGPPAPAKNIPPGYYVLLSLHSSLCEDDVTADLEPAVKRKSPENFACRVRAKLTAAESASGTTAAKDLVQQAIALHPLRCAKSRFLHRAHILVVDTANPVENGMLMVKLPRWDTGRLAAATRGHLRLPYACHDSLQMRFPTLVNGAAEWPSAAVRARPVFVPGEKRLAYAPELVRRPVHGLERNTRGYDEAVLCFPWPWDGVVWGRMRDELLGLPVDGVKSVRTGINGVTNGRNGEQSLRFLSIGA